MARCWMERVRLEDRAPVAPLRSIHRLAATGEASRLWLRWVTLHPDRKT